MWTGNYDRPGIWRGSASYVRNPYHTSSVPHNATAGYHPDRRYQAAAATQRLVDTVRQDAIRQDLFAGYGAEPMLLFPGSFRMLFARSFFPRA